MKNYFKLLFALPLLWTISCDDLENGPQLVVGSATEDTPTGRVTGGVYNGGMEELSPSLLNMPNGWRNFIQRFNAPNNFTVSQSSEAIEGSFSLLIEASAPIDDENEYAYAQQIIQNPGLPPTTQVRLSAQVKTEDLSGDGFEILLLTPDTNSNSLVALASSRPSSIVSGNQGWREFTADISSFPNNVDELYIWIRVMPSTTGKVYIDDLRLTYEFL